MGLLTVSITRTIPEKRMGWFRGVRLTAYAVGILIEEVLTILWERREEGYAGYVALPFRLLKYVLCTGLFFVYFGRGAHMTFLLVSWFHRVDDVIDGDSALPDGWTIQRYAEQKQKLLASISNGHTDTEMLYEDLLLMKALKASRRMELDIAVEACAIWSVLTWERTVRETRRLPSRQEMVEYTTVLDRAVLRFAVKAARGNLERFDMLAREFNGVFTRTDWLDDILIDVHQGIINLPAEAVEQHGVEVSNLCTCASWDDLMGNPSFAAWYRNELTQSASEWAHLHRILGDDFGGVFESKFITWIFVRLTIGKLKTQFQHAADRAA